MTNLKDILIKKNYYSLPNENLTDEVFIPGIESSVFAQFQKNPEHFISETSRLINEQKATLLYQEIERNTLFVSPIPKEDRSLMNIPFVFSKEMDESDFLSFCQKRGLMTLKGHRSVGGFRASIYNAMPVEGVEALVSAMKEYESING